MLKTAYSKTFDAKAKPTATGIADPENNPHGYSQEDSIKATDTQWKTSGFAVQTKEASKVLDAYNANDSKLSAKMTQTLDQVAASMEGKTTVDTIIATTLGKITDPIQKELMGARLRWAQNALRYESGAAISASEYFAKLRSYFPDETSSDAEIKNMANARKQLEKGLILASGPAIGGYDLNSYTPTVTPLSSTISKEDSDEIDTIQ
jgi:vancomycin resistance protein YoaR